MVSTSAGRADPNMLQKALAELKASTKVTMETVGVRCNRRVTTALYKEGLKRLRGPVVVQPPSEDRVSVFVGLVGGKQACLKIFSTGKVRCLKSDFNTQEDAETCAQAIIDRMASVEDSGMPHIRLSDAKFHANGKDLTWSTRQTTDIRKLSKAFQDAGFRAESDTSFGDSVMVVISPPGSDRSVKGQVLADGTIRLAGCRDDGEGAARCVAQSLNETGCLLGGKVDVDSLRCEVWLTKRHFQLCTPEWVVDMTALHRLLNAEKNGVQCAHPTMKEWIRAREEEEFVRSIKVVGTACPRAEVKFMPVVLEEWEQVKRKPEPVSISIHHRGEVQLAGNAEYKVLQAFWFIKDLVHRHASEVLVPPPTATKKEAAASAKPTKRKLDVRREEEAPVTDLEPRSLSFSTPAKPAPPPVLTPARSASSCSSSLSPSSAPPSAHDASLAPLQLPSPTSSSSSSSAPASLLSPAAEREARYKDMVLFGNSPNLDHPLFSATTFGSGPGLDMGHPLFYGQPLPVNAAEIAAPPEAGSEYHAQQLMCLAVLRSLCQRALTGEEQPAAAAADADAHTGWLAAMRGEEREGQEREEREEGAKRGREASSPRSPTGEEDKTEASGRETPLSPKRQRTLAMPVPKPSPIRQMQPMSKSRLSLGAAADRSALEELSNVMVA